MPRPKGIPKTGGRKKGSLNKATIAAKEACARIVDDEEYQRQLLEAARARKLAPAVEALLWYYAKGKPREQVSVEGGVDYRWLDNRDDE